MCILDLRGINYAGLHHTLHGAPGVDPTAHASKGVGYTRAGRQAGLGWEANASPSPQKAQPSLAAPWPVVEKHTSTSTGAWTEIEHHGTFTFPSPRRDGGRLCSGWLLLPVRPSPCVALDPLALQFDAPNDVQRGEILPSRVLNCSAAYLSACCIEEGQNRIE